MKHVKGGEKIKKILMELGNIKDGSYVETGFFDESTYPDGTSVATVAFINEFGATIEAGSRDSKGNAINKVSDISEEDKNNLAYKKTYKKMNKQGKFLKKGRFVKKSESNFETKNFVKGHSITIPSRPFFRTAIEEKKGEWAGVVLNALKAGETNINVILSAVGEKQKSDIRKSIIAWNDPGNASSTIKKKGFNKPLIDTKFMLDSVSYKVVKNDD